MRIRRGRRRRVAEAVRAPRDGQRRRRLLPRSTAGPRTRSSPSPTARCTSPRPPARTERGAGRLATTRTCGRSTRPTLALLDRHDPAVLLETILTRATALLGTPHGFIYLVDPDGDGLVVRHGIRAFSPFVGQPPRRSRRAWAAVCSRPERRSPSTTTTRSVRAGDVPIGVRRRRRRAAQRRATRWSGVIGLASGTSRPAFGPREIDALSRFAQLASIALDNARLVDDAQRGALYDATTGLPEPRAADRPDRPRPGRPPRRRTRTRSR